MQLLYYSLAFALPILAASAPEEKEKPRTPCAIRSPTSGAFFDLNAVRVHIPDSGEKLQKDARNASWPARGWDYGANFTLNICGPVYEKLDDVVGVPESRWKNVSAYYQMDGRTYSIGSQNDQPVFRGRKLVLNYTDGSPCPSAGSSTVPRSLDGRKILDDDDEEDHPHTKTSTPKSSPTPSASARRKNTIISFLCAADPLAPPMAVSFVASPDSCTYIFEARTPAACGGVEVAQQQLGPAGVFGVIALIAVLVYLVGGCFYQRTVMHQRGWRQLPNYSLWAGIGGFFKDLIVISTSSCARCLPAKRGYRRLSNGTPTTGGRRGRHDSDDENRLIDQLDEEWED